MLRSLHGKTSNNDEGKYEIANDLIDNGFCIHANDCYTVLEKLYEYNHIDEETRNNIAKKLLISRYKTMTSDTRCLQLIADNIDNFDAILRSIGYTDLMIAIIRGNTESVQSLIRDQNQYNDISGSQENIVSLATKMYNAFSGPNINQEKHKIYKDILNIFRNNTNVINDTTWLKDSVINNKSIIEIISSDDFDTNNIQYLIDLFYLFEKYDSQNKLMQIRDIIEYGKS